MSTQYQETKKPLIGSTGRIGSRVIAEIAKVDALEAVYSSRTLEQVGAWRKDGKDAVLVDLDRPETFREALTGVDRLFLATGYTVAMVHQSKTIVDAAADAGVSFIVHLSIFGNGRMTYPYATWHEMVERYIEGSGVAWTHLHLTSSWTTYLLRLPSWMASYTGSWANRRVGWVAPEDVAAVAPKALADGHERHGGNQYWLSADFLNGTQAAAEISKGLGLLVKAVVLTPCGSGRTARRFCLQLHESLTARLGSGARVFRCIAFINAPAHGVAA